MSIQPVVSNTFYLSGDPLERLRQALRVVGHQARLAQGGAEGRHLEDALSEIEEAIGSYLARLDNALEDDKAEAEDSGEADHQRRSWFARYEAV